MKATLTLPERPSALYLLAVFDVLAAMLILFTLIPGVAQQAGMEAELVEMTSRLPSQDLGKKMSLTVLPGRLGAPVQVSLGTRRIDYQDLQGELIRAREDDGVKSIVVLADGHLDWLVINDLAFKIDAAGLRGLFAGKPSSTSQGRPGPPAPAPR